MASWRRHAYTPHKREGNEVGLFYQPPKSTHKQKEEERRAKFIPCSIIQAKIEKNEGREKRKPRRPRERRVRGKAKVLSSVEPKGEGASVLEVLAAFREVFGCGKVRNLRYGHTTSEPPRIYGILVS